MDDLMQATAEQTIKLLGSQVSYISQSGVKTTVYCLIDKNVEVYPDGFETGASQRRTELSFILSDVENIKHGEKIVSGNTLYTVADVLEDDGYVIKVSVK